MPADAEHWDRRYAETDRVWRAEPHEQLADVVRLLPRGSALDVAAGEGRHSVWLAEQGWRVTAIDFSAVGLQKGRAEAERRGLDIEWVVGDVTSWAPERTYDLVLVAFLHIGPEVYATLRSHLAPGGHLVVVGHARRNITDGVGGPQDPDLLEDTASLAVAAGDLQVLRNEEVERHTAAGTAVDVLLVARRA